MIVAFLDLLGFSSLLGKNAETALDNLDAVNDAIKMRITDPKDVFQSDSDDALYNEKWTLTSISQMISFSDSVVFSGDDANSFVQQLADVVARIYINRIKPFKKQFDDISRVVTDQNVDSLGGGYFRPHQAAPIFFRGGVSVGNQVTFIDQFNIKDKEIFLSRNITGMTYLEAVRLEKSGKGPRLFCNKSVVDAISDKNVKNMIKRIKGENELYEIVWTMEGCSVPGNCSDQWKNVLESIDTTMLLPAINLYCYYQEDEILKEQYEKLLKLVCCGIVKYADVECNRAGEAIDLINKKLQKISMINTSILEDFLD